MQWKAKVLGLEILSFDPSSATFASWVIWAAYILSLNFLHSFAVKKKWDNWYKRYEMESDKV